MRCYICDSILRTVNIVNGEVQPCGMCQDAVDEIVFEYDVDDDFTEAELEDIDYDELDY